MQSVLDRKLFFVKEHTGIFKAANSYDVFDPESNQLILECREDSLGFLTKMLRFTDWKTMTPFDVKIRTPDGQQVVRVKRGVSLFLSKVQVFDQHDMMVGGFKQKFFSIGGKFDVLDSQDNPLCSLKGKWTGWDFRFMGGDTEYGHVSKKWAGMGKELFTSADNYMLEISDLVPQGDPLRCLILGAVMCIDMVLKEK